MPKRAVPADGRRVNVNTKVTQEIREKIEAAAAASDRPISSEIEFRLDQSFANEVIIKALVGSDIQGEMFRRLADVVTSARRFCREYEFTETKTREVISAACIRVVTIYCWTSGKLTQESPIRIHGKPVRLNEMKPEYIGIEIADSAMMWNDDQALEDLDVQVANRWSGDGRTAEWRAKLSKHGNSPGTKPLKEIMGR